MAKKKASNVFVWIMMALLIAGLGGFGLTNFGGSVRTVATVGDIEIDYQTYARALQNQAQSYEQLTGQPLTIQQARALGFDRSALAQVIRDAALTNSAANAGISIGDENVSREITKSPAFRGLSGEFNRETYELALRQNGITVREFESRVRGDVSNGILSRAISEGIQTPELFTDTLFNFARETRDVTWARLTADDLLTPLEEPSGSELRKFHEDNSELFTQGETRVIQYAWLTPEMIIDQIQVDGDRVRELYDSRIDEFVQPERRLVERLVFANDAEAQAAKARLDGGETIFDDLISARGLDLDDVDMGDVAVEELGEAGAEVFALEEPNVVGPLPSPFGPALYRMNAVLAAQEVSFEDARAELEAEAAADRARRIIAESISQIEDLLAGGASTEQLAERTDMQASKIEWRDEQTEGIAGYSEFRAAAVRAEVGDFAEVTELEDGGIFTLVLDDIKAPSVIPFEDIRGEVVASWETSETESALTAQAEAISERIRQGTEMAGLGLSLKTDRALERTSFIEETPPDFTDEIFDMKLNDVRVLSADGDAWLVRLDNVQAPDSSAPGAQVVRLQFAQESANELSVGLLDAFIQALLQDSDVSVNQAALTAVHSQMN
ncbi:MAG: SurA N-terminal domain-containing protein [Boseongicola sp.]